MTKVAIHRTQLTDDEIDAKAAELRKTADAHYAHAAELERWKTDPRRTKPRARADSEVANEGPSVTLASGPGVPKSRRRAFGLRALKY